MPAGRMQPWIALVYGIVLMLIATPWMALYTSKMAAALAVIAWAVYVFLYTPMKRKSWLNVLVGGIAGAMPPLIGWTSVTGSIDAPGLALFAILFLWQMPHSLAISMYLKEEYTAAGLKVLPAEVSDSATRVHIFGYVVALVAVSLYLAELGLGGIVTVIGSAALGIPFLWKAWRGLRIKGDAVWARDLFLYSLLYLSGLFVVMAVDHVL